MFVTAANAQMRFEREEHRQKLDFSLASLWPKETINTWSLRLEEVCRRNDKELLTTSLMDKECKVNEDGGTEVRSGVELRSSSDLRQQLAVVELPEADNCRAS